MTPGLINNMTQATQQKPGTRRTASKEARRAQLIQATINTIARNGISDTTMATVAGEAKLSQGIINLHFQSKERLLVETLRHVVDEYRQAWERALDAAPPGSAAQLAALVSVDFSRRVCDRNKLAVWFAFWGESKSRPTYRKLCAERDAIYDRQLAELCCDLANQPEYSGIDGQIVSRGLSAMTEGLWLDMLLSPSSISREEARAVSMAYLARYYPKHFAAPGETPA